MADGEGNRDQGENNQTSSNNAMDVNLPNGEASLDTMVQAYAQEYENLDHTLDEIDSWMNKLEEQNNSLSNELDLLLESSRQARLELKELDKESSNTDGNEVMDSSDASGKKSS